MHGGIDATDLLDADYAKEFIEEFDRYRDDYKIVTRVEFNKTSKERILSSLTDAAAGTVDYYFKRDDDARLTCTLTLQKLEKNVLLGIFKAVSDLGSSRLYMDSNTIGGHEAINAIDSSMWKPQQVMDLLTRAFNCSEAEVLVNVVKNGDSIGLEVPVTIEEALALQEKEDVDTAISIIVDAVFDQPSSLEELCVISGLEAGFKDLRSSDLSNEEVVAFAIQFNKV